MAINTEGSFVELLKSVCDYYSNSISDLCRFLEKHKSDLENLNFTDSENDLKIRDVLLKFLAEGNVDLLEEHMEEVESRLYHG